MRRCRHSGHADFHLDMALCTCFLAVPNARTAGRCVHAVTRSGEPRASSSECRAPSTERRASSVASHPCVSLHFLHRLLPVSMFNVSQCFHFFYFFSLLSFRPLELPSCDCLSRFISFVMSCTCIFVLRFSDVCFQSGTIGFL